MPSLKSVAAFALSLLIAMPALADVTNAVTSPETEIPRLNKIKKYDVKVGVTYKDPGGVAPIFDITRYKVKPQDGSRAVLGVEIPSNATVVSVKGLMKNEPWGGSRRPPKANTDDLGTTDYKSCPMGNGDCPIAWSDVSAYADYTTNEGKRFITAAFRNWAGRNDRTGKLEVTYTVPQ
jgi:hypothetical protein